MLPYFIANIISLSFIYIGYRFKFNRIALTSIFVLSAIPLIIISSFKYIKVGTDTESYVHYFDKLNNLSATLSMIDKQGEAGFWYLNYLGHFISHDYFIIFLFSSLIITACYFYCIKVFNLKTLSLFTLLFIGPYYFQLNGTRQAITIAIFAISVIFIIKKQPVRYITSIFIGFLFHKSIIICLPLYFIFKGEIKPRKIAVIIFIFLIVVVFFQSFINLASSVDDRYSSYGDQQDSHGGLVVSTFNISLFCWFFLCRVVNIKALANRTFDILLSLYFLGTLVSLLSILLKIDPSGFLRMSIYFIQMSIFLLPMTILSFRDDNTRYIIIFSTVVLMTFYFYLTTKTFSNLTPYKFNPIVEIHDKS
ncbi:MAG: EpsG family protein [Colwellia sp.]|nr:EpsG family protein [Colwellia sp.]